ncbi:MAG TPA: zinc chelation protein SecC [Porticoccaceae bacterium]|nr:zinc chelation protein SecC [Porticoccaceae bacterium]
MNDSTRPVSKDTHNDNTSSCSNAACCPPSQQPISRLAPKIGRNDTCPCGTGRKFKKCCGQHR